MTNVVRLDQTKKGPKLCTAPKETETGGDINDIVTLPAAARANVERIRSASQLIRPVSGMFTTKSALVIAGRHVDQIIAEAMALREQLAPYIPQEN